MAIGKEGNVKWVDVSGYCLSRLWKRRFFGWNGGDMACFGSFQMGFYRDYPAPSCLILVDAALVSFSRESATAVCLRSH